MPLRFVRRTFERVYLVDTNVLSASAPARAETPELIGWMDRNSVHLFLSVITVAEIEEGIAKARRSGAVKRADRLAEWFDTLLHLYAPRILPLDVHIAKILGRLADQARGSGHDPGLADLAIAATASVRGYTVLTRNLRHFGFLAVPVHDPFASLPAGLK